MTTTITDIGKLFKLSSPYGCTWAEQSIHGYSPVECTKHNPFVRIDEILHIAIDELHPFINMCGCIEMVEL